ncbi:MAG: matrixin family metalloprotease [Flavobacteriales bacterium]
MKNFLIISSLSVLCITCSFGKKRIGIQPYENIPLKVLDSVSQIVCKSYNADVIILKSKSLPKKAFVNIKTPRYRADSLLIDLLENKPDSVDYILGITSKDISTTKRNTEGNIKEPESKYLDWGIFGLGYKPGRSCIISTFRLKNTSQKLFFDRIQKIAVHEIGHNMGLNHCETNNCVMQDAVETIKTVDFANKELCSKCKSNI